MKPNITLYSATSADKTKKFESFIEAAFWIGTDYFDEDLESVKIRQPNESYDVDVANLLDFANLLVRKQISFKLEFFTEPEQATSLELQEVEKPAQEPATSGKTAEEEEGLKKLDEEFSKGGITKKQYEARRDAMLKRWKSRVEEGLSK